ncbi:EthD domain-containing protein [Trichoderma chlorosporum]
MYKCLLYLRLSQLLTLALNHMLNSSSSSYLISIFTTSPTLWSTAIMSTTLYKICFIRRRPDLTEEQFYNHWRNVHAPIIAPWAKKHGIIGYTQIHTSSALRQPLTTTSLPITVMDYDGAVIWEIPSLEAFLNAFNDPYYASVIAPDEENFVDKSKEVATVTLGHFHNIVAGGEPLIDYTSGPEPSKAE